MITTEINGFNYDNTFYLVHLHFRKILDILDFLRGKLQALSVFYKPIEHVSPTLALWPVFLDRYGRNQSSFAYYLRKTEKFKVKKC